ncbi:LysR substrate-binding domain-containing protein, partial [Methanopyrus kandleri]
MVKVVEIATGTIPGTYLMPKLMAEFKREHPDVHPRILVCDSLEATRMVETNLVDLAAVGTLRFLSVSEEELPFLIKEGFRVGVIDEEELVLVVPADHELAEKDEVDVEDLKGVDYVNREPGSGTRREVERFLREHGMEFDDLNVVQELGSTDAVLRAVAQGMGVSIVSEKAAEEYERTGDIKVVRLKGRPTRKLYAVRA